MRWNRMKTINWSRSLTHRAGHGKDRCPGVTWHVLRHGLGTGAPRWRGMSIGMAWGHLHDRWGGEQSMPVKSVTEVQGWHQLRQWFGWPGSCLWKLDPPLQKWGAAVHGLGCLTTRTGCKARSWGAHSTALQDSAGPRPEPSTPPAHLCTEIA